MNRKEILCRLRAESSFLKRVDLMGPLGQVDVRKSKKLQEVAGFAEIILRYLLRFPVRGESLTILEGSCGKSYLGFVLSFLVPQVCGKSVRLLGVDSNAALVDRCRILADDIGLEDAFFTCSKIIDFKPEMDIDMVVSLHACDTATDEALVQGIRSGASQVHAVPCCQNQIRGQIKGGHALETLTGYGPVRYRVANLLTDVLRAEFMKAAGYHVELDEIGSPKLTPKNLCISARKVKRRGLSARDEGYRHIRDMFGLKVAIEKMCPGVIND